MKEFQIGADQNPEIPTGIEVNLDLANKHNVKIVARLATLGGTTKVLRRMMYTIFFVGVTWKVTKAAMVIACGKKTTTLYITSIVIAEDSTNASLQHCKLGHMSEK